MRKCLALFVGLALVVCLSGSAFAQTVSVGAGYWPMSTNMTQEETTFTDVVTGNAIMVWGECAVGERLGLGVFYSGLSNGVVANEPFFGPATEEPNIFESASDSYTRVYASFDLLPDAPSLAPLAGYVRTGLTLMVDPDVANEVLEGEGELAAASIGYGLSGYAAGASASADLGALTVRGAAAYLFGLTGQWTADANGTVLEGEANVPVSVHGTAPVTATGLELSGAIGYRITPQLTVEAGYRYVSLNVSEGELSGEMQYGEIVEEFPGEGEEPASVPAMSFVTDGFFVGLTYRF